MNQSITLVNVKTGLPETFEADERGIVRLPAGDYQLLETLSLGEGIRIEGTSPHTIQNCKVTNLQKRKR
jgi:hypothetical protein